MKTKTTKTISYSKPTASLANNTKTRFAWSNAPQGLTLALIGFVLSTAFVSSLAGQSSGRVVTVHDPASLGVALLQATPGQRILLRPGTYEIGSGIHVPTAVTLFSQGLMKFDETGWPIGFEAANRTVLKAAPGLAGNVVTLGDGASLENLVIEDIPGRSGNVVVISSRMPGDTVGAEIERCEIINPNPAAAGPEGPRGRGVLVMTRNPNLAAAPPPDDSSDLALHMTESLVHSPGGGSGVFAINFSSRSQVALFLRGNVIGGGVDTTAGASRPDAVQNSRVTINSSNNLYRSDSASPTATGWLLGGGTDAPVPGIVAGGATANALRVQSIGDRIEGFVAGIMASAGRRNGATAGASSANEVEIHATNLFLATSTNDLLLSADRSFVAGMSAGNGNLLRVNFRGTSGSGLRDNRYQHGTSFVGVDNRLEIVGNATAFQATNEGIIPAPPSEFFTGSR